MSEVKGEDLVDAAQLAACHLAGFYQTPIRLHRDGPRMILMNEVPRASVEQVRGKYVLSPLVMPEDDFARYARNFID